ncbi:MAG TPA: DNA polymerase Y family protein, partial [Candidatus Binatia bacterium]|nr:DNA polymerase Y family protein [Candidatus Binatia bacterium]
SLAAGLRAGEVSSTEIDKATTALADRLMRFTPEVEPSAEEPGVFWLDGRGLERLYASLQNWAYAIYKEMEAQGFHANLALGFTRFGTYAVAKTKPGITIFSDIPEEKKAAQKIPLDRLDLDADFRDALLKLGIKTIGALLSLPPGALRERFGPKAHHLYRVVAGDLRTPLNPCEREEPPFQRRLLDDPESDTTRLLFLLKQLLHPILATLAARAQALASLSVAFLIDRNGWLREQIRPAAPTLETAQIIDLLRLRLESMNFPAGVVEIELLADSCAATAEQLRLFAEGPTRDVEAANRALARLRAEFGDDSVVQAKLTDGHLPEARFAWEPLSRIKLPRLNRHPAALAPNDLNRLNDLNVLNFPILKVLVRRIMAKPQPLSSSPHQIHEDGWLLLGPKYGAVDKLTGPYLFSGGWWNREIHREYYFAETRRGQLLWIYYDRPRRRWFLQGSVE